MSQTTFNATVAGNIEMHDGGSWAGVRDNATGTVYTNEVIAKGQYYGGNYYIRRGFITFDTSSLSDSATVSAVSLRLVNLTNGDGINGGIYVVNNTQDSNTVLASADYNNVDTTNLGFAADASITGTYDISVSTASVSLTSYSKYALRTANDFSNVEPASGTEDYYAHNTSPQLLVTWTTPPTVTTAAAASITDTTATLGGNITGAGGGTVSTAGVCWNTSTNPTTANSKTATATTSGAFTVAATGLTKNTLYYARAYVTTENSTAYGDNVTFTTDTDPAVTTGATTNLQPLSATLGGNITSNGNSTVTTAGVCWATTSSPTTSSSKTATATVLGAYTVSATGLIPGTLYYYRAYVTTSVSTQYGDNATFRTPAGAILFNLL